MVGFVVEKENKRHTEFKQKSVKTLVVGVMCCQHLMRVSTLAAEF